MKWWGWIVITPGALAFGLIVFTVVLLAANGIWWGLAAMAAGAVVGAAVPTLGYLILRRR